MLSDELKKFFFPLKAVSFFLFFLIYSIDSFSQGETKAIFILKGNTKLLSGKSAEGVEMELKKNGQTISKVITAKNGKYYIQMDVSTSNPQNDYLLNITMPGAVPKLLSINAYIPQEEYKVYTFPRYDYSLEIVMTETSMKEIVLEKPS